MELKGKTGYLNGAYWYGTTGEDDKTAPYKYQVQMGCCQLQDPTPFVTHYGKKIENDLSPLLNIIEDIITAE